MNALLRLRKDMTIAGIVPFRYLLYTAMLSNVTIYEPEDEDTRYGIYGGEQSDLYDHFSDWTDEDIRCNEVYNSLNELSEEGLIFFDDESRIYLGEFRGRRFFTFEKENTLYEKANELLDENLRRYGSSKSAKDKSRAHYIREQIDRLKDKGIENLSPGDFTDLHGYLYEIYTGGEIYIVRGKAEHFQTNNMLKAYDKFTVYSLLVEATLRYDTYRRKGVPTLTNVACMKDDVFRELTQSAKGSKEYMRDMTSSVDEDSGF